MFAAVGSLLTMTWSHKGLPAVLDEAKRSCPVLLVMTVSPWCAQRVSQALGPQG